MNKILNPNSSARNSRAFAAWGALTINLIHSYDPETIIFGGGLKSAHVIVPALQSIVDEQATMPGGRASLKVVSLGDAAALLGTE
jgi:predicted NBD/HSP70 family sugar kinase